MSGIKKKVRVRRKGNPTQLVTGISVTSCCGSTFYDSSASHRHSDAFSYVSLFSGCGGFDSGFEAEGFHGTGAFDLDPVAVSTHRQNIQRSIQISDLRRAVVPAHLRNVGVLLSGSPCQGFSTAGKRDLQDPRNQLIISAGHMAIEIRPRIFIAENVAGITAGAHRFYWDWLKHILRWAGYRTMNLTYEATDLGLPQTRKRCIMLAWLGGREPCTRLPDTKTRRLSDVLVGLDGIADHTPVLLDEGGKERVIAEHIAQGQKLSDVRDGISAVHTWHIPEVFGVASTSEKVLLESILKLRRRQRTRNFGDADPVDRSILRQSFGDRVERLINSLLKKEYLRDVDGKVDLKRTFNGLYRRPRWDGQSTSVDTRFGLPRLFLHPLENRGFTVREAARIQGFPDSFRFNGTTKDKFRLIGNAVPPPMSQFLATICRKLLY